MCCLWSRRKPICGSKIPKNPTGVCKDLAPFSVLVDRETKVQEPLVTEDGVIMTTVRTIEEIASQVDDKWRDSFLKFVESGEADEDFLDYIDANIAIQTVIDDAFRVQAESIDELTSELAEIRQNNLRPEVVAAARNIKQMVEMLHNMTDTGRQDFRHLVASQLDNEDKQELATICNDVSTRRH